jgi:hypothetical protein
LTSEYFVSSPSKIEGWLGDFGDDELQSIIFHTKFVTTLPTDPASLPCRPGTIAAALFANSQCDEGKRLVDKLTEQAALISSAGLAFYDALMADWQRRIAEL